MIDSDDIFHIGYERGAPLRRDFPILPEVRLKFVFLSMRCIVICETLWARCSSTAFSARIRTVQRRRPSGDSEQAKAITRASKAPSKISSRDGFSGCLRTNAAANPSSTKRFLRCSMVRGVTPMASAVSATVHAGPKEPASHRSKARAKEISSHWSFPFSQRLKFLAFLLRQGYSVSWCHGKSLPLEFAMIISHYTNIAMLHGTSTNKCIDLLRRLPG